MPESFISSPLGALAQRLPLTSYTPHFIVCTPLFFIITLQWNTLNSFHYPNESTFLLRPYIYLSPSFSPSNKALWYCSTNLLSSVVKRSHPFLDEILIVLVLDILDISRSVFVHLKYTGKYLQVTTEVRFEVSFHTQINDVYILLHARFCSISLTTWK